MEISLRSEVTQGHLLLLAAFLLHFSNISGLSIYALDEAKNATAAMEMWKNKEWIIPTFNGEYRFDKPPLHYYFFMVAYQFFGVNAFSARLFPAIFGFLTTLLTYRFAKKNLGHQTGNLTLLILTCSLHWHIQFHMAVPDPFLIFFMTLAMMAFFEWSKSGFRSTKNRLITYAALALAVLSKGPIGLALPCLAFLFYSLSMQLLNRKRLQRIFHPVGLIIFFLIALPWYIMVAIKTDGLWISSFLFKHNLGRFAAPMEGHGGGFWLTWLFVFLGMLPFSFFLPQSIGYTLKFKTNKLITFALVCSGIIICFFMLSGTKLPNYTVPAYPFLAILMGNYLSHLTQKRKKRSLLFPAVLVGILIVLLPFGIYHGLQNAPHLTTPKSILWMFMLPFMVLPMGIWAYRKNRLLTLLYCIGSGYMLIAFVFFWLAFPKMDRQNPVLKARPITHFMNGEKLYYYKIFNPAFSFYLQQPLENLEEVTTTEKISGYLFTRKQYLGELEEMDLEFERVFEGKDLFESPTTVILRVQPVP